MINLQRKTTINTDYLLRLKENVKVTTFEVCRLLDSPLTFALPLDETHMKW